jgi:hypothetical protein
MYSGYYFLSGVGVCRFLCRIFNQWEFSPFFYRSSVSGETYYILLTVPEGQKNKRIVIRCSDHAPKRWKDIKPADYEVALTMARKDATGYPKLLLKLANLYGKELPPVMTHLLKPENYRFYRLWQQQNTSHKSWRPTVQERLYFPQNPAKSPRKETA